MSIKLNYGVNFHYDNRFFSQIPQYGGITLHQFGEMSCEGEFSCSPHKQWCHEITYIISGKATFIIDSKVIQAKEGDLIISPLSSIHEIHVSKGNEVRYAYLAFEFNEKESSPDFLLLKEFYKPNMQRVFAKDTYDAGSIFIRCIDEYYKKNSCYQIMFECFLKQIIILTRRAVIDDGNKQKKIGNVGEAAVGSAVYAVIRYIEDNLCEIEHIRDICFSLGYTHSYISKLFHRKMGMTIQQYIGERKMEKAISLVRFGNYTITQVAAKLNYANIQSFSRAFSHIKHMSPREYFSNAEKNEQLL